MCLANGQFLPQSHLGRLVQSITSPLVISTSSYRAEQESAEPASGYHPDSSAASYYPSHQHHGTPMDEAAHLAHQHQLQPQPQMERPDGLRMQQSPSQQRGVPQQYYHRQSQHQPQRHHNLQQQQMMDYHQQQQQQQQQQMDSNLNSNLDGGFINNQEDNDERDQGAAPSNHRQRNNNQNGAQNQNGPSDYQMGAYLGPVIDDKEINTAFNSNNDDDEPASYDGHSNSGLRNKAASSAYGTNHEDPSSASYPMGGGQASADEGDSQQGYGNQHQSPRPMSGGEQSRGYHGAGYDEDSVDEDESPAAQRPRGSGNRPLRGVLSGAASHYRQQGGYGSGSGGSSAVDNGDQGEQQALAGGYKHQSAANMMAAANGYAPFGYANGPVDLTGLMNGGGGDSFALYGAGAGAYPGANPYGQPQQGQRGGRNQAASMNNYNGLYGGQRANNDNDDQDNDNDDD